MEQVIEKSLLAVPHFVVMFADAVHRIRDPEEMLHKAESDIFIHLVIFCEDERNLQHILAVERHPCRAVGLIQVPPCRQRCTTIEHTDVVQSQESTGKHILPCWILPVNPPIEVLH